MNMQWVKFFLILCLTTLLASLCTTSCGSTLVLEPSAVMAAPQKTVSLVPLTLAEANQQTSKISIDYSWKFAKIEWTWQLRVPESLYLYFKGLPREPGKDYTVYITHPKDDGCLDKMVTEIKRIVELYGFSQRQMVEFTAAFVQSLSYVTDSNTTQYKEYPRYPIETLVEKGGDCEDTSILLASLINRMNLGVALIYFPTTSKKQGHYGVGISDIKDAYGTNWKYEGKKYFYLETTRKGWRIGAIPSAWAHISPEIYLLTPLPFIVHSWSLEDIGSIINLKVTVSNIGSATAHNIQVFAYYDIEDNLVFESDYNSDMAFNAIEISPQFELKTGETKIVCLTLKPLREHIKLLVQVVSHS